MDLRAFMDGENLASRAFYKALQAEDELGMIVRAHIHIESKLREFVQTAAPAPQYFKPSSYSHTLRLAMILGLNAELHSALSAVGKLRNDFAHNVDTSLGEAQAARLHDAMGPKVREVAEYSYSKLREDSPDKPESTAQLAPRDRVSLYLIAVRGGIVISIAAAKGLFNNQGGGPRAFGLQGVQS
jgi:hypothetical protein